MTIKEFSQKYEITYHLAYLASYGVQPVSNMCKDRDFPEEALYKSLQSLLNKRDLEYCEKINQIQQQKARLRWIRCNKS